MDVYSPLNVAAVARLPALIFLNTGGVSQRAAAVYSGWGPVAAAHNMIAVVPDLRGDHMADDFDALLAYLASHAGELRLNPGAIAVYAASGNVSRALPLVEDPARTAVKAAVIYYGSAAIKNFRRDLPLLLVRAGLDRPGMNELFDGLAHAAILQNAPATVLNYAGGHHAFELVDINDATREVMEQTFQFLQSVLTPKYQASLRIGMMEAAAAAAVQSGDFPQAAAAYAVLAEQRPNDPRVLLSHGEALLGAKRYKEALVQFERVKVLGHTGPRDLCIPAAMAAALDGDPEAAVAWLKLIPRRFLTADLKEEAAFRSLLNRADFQALFR